MTTTYIIEGNLVFNDELYKMIDVDTDDEVETCKITMLPLKEYFVTLECNHKFNYVPLYTELYKQQYEGNTYSTKSMSPLDIKKFANVPHHFYIKCPYCRNIQFQILPYYEELGLAKVYGINSVDETLPNAIVLKKSKNASDTFMAYNVLFEYGICSKSINNFGDKCSNYFVAPIPNTNLTYCTFHYEKGLKQHNLKQQLNELNAIREMNGMPLFKKLPIYTNNSDSSNISSHWCDIILKSGPRKGLKCGCNKMDNSEYCKRHQNNTSSNTANNTSNNTSKVKE